MEKLDLKKQYKELYVPSAKQVAVVEVPRLQFAMLDGHIEPGEAPATSTTFQEAVEALYGISYTLKFMSKQRDLDPIDYAVMALEALWWADQGEFDLRKKDAWNWTAMILQPDHITAEMFAEGLERLRAKRDSAAVERLRLESWQEGLCVQIMHIGPYDAEPATLDRLYTYAQEQGYRLRGKHHEVYLGDPRRTSPNKLKTVLRQPVGRV